MYESAVLRRDLYTVAEVAQLLGVHEETVRRMVRAGIIPAFKLGHSRRSRTRISREDLDAYLGADPEEAA